MIFGFLLAAAMILTNLGNAEVKRFEHGAAEDILSRISCSEAKVDVKVRMNGIVGGALGDLAEATVVASHFTTDGLPLLVEPERNRRGKVGTLSLRLSDFTLSGLAVAELSADIHDCRYDYPHALRHRKIRLTKSGEGPGEVFLRYPDIEAFLKRKFSGLTKLTIRPVGSAVEVIGEGQFALIETGFHVIGALASDQGSKINVARARLYLGDKRADEAATEAVLSALNPIVDLDRDLGLLGAVKLQRIELKPDGILASGIAHIPDMPQPRPTLLATLFP